MTDPAASLLLDLRLRVKVRRGDRVFDNGQARMSLQELTNGSSAMLGRMLSEQNLPFLRLFPGQLKTTFCLPGMVCNCSIFSMRSFQGSQHYR
jgi:hypothetical protein